MTGSEMQVSGGNWQEELATRARSRKAGNSGAGVWGEREGERKGHKMPMDHSWILNLGLKPVSTRLLLKRSPPAPTIITHPGAVVIALCVCLYF